MKRLLVVLVLVCLAGAFVEAGVYINEVEIDVDGTDSGNEWIEIYNNVGSIDLDGWYIKDKDNHKFYFPDVVIVDFYVLDGLNAFTNSGDNVSIYDDGDNLIDNTGWLVDQKDNNSTWQRTPDGVGGFEFREQTKGLDNDGVLEEKESQDIYGYLVNETLVQNESYPTCAFRTENLTISARVIWGECLGGEVWARVKFGDLEWQNFSASLTTNGTYEIFIDSNLLNVSNNISFQFFAEDCYNFSYAGDVNNFTIKNETYLGVVPWPADGLNGWFVTEPLFSLVADGVGNIYYQWDSDAVYDYVSPFGLEDAPNSGNVTAGTLELNWWADFSCGVEPVNTKMFYVDLMDPVINDLQPIPDEEVYNFRPVVSSYIDEVYGSNSGVNLSSVVMEVDGVAVNASIVGVGGLDATVSYLPSVNLSEGWHNVSVYVVDNAGRDSYEFWEFEVGVASSFVMDIFSPVDGYSDSRRVVFNLTVDKEVEKIEYINYANRRPRWKRLCRDCDEYGFSRKKTKSLREGNNTLGFRATDDIGEVVEENVSVFVDSRAPRISKVFPRRNSFTNGSGFYVKYSEENAVRLSIFYNESLNLSLDNCSNGGRYWECYFDLNLSGHNGEEIEYRFELEDVVGNVVSSRVVGVNVDTSAPVLNNNDSFWEQGVGRYSRYVYFDLNISEENLDEVSYLYIDSRNKTREKRLCSRLRDGVCEKRRSFRRGDELLGIRIVDEAGNSVFEEIGLLIDY